MVFSKEGERGDELVVILEGQVEVSRDGERLATLGPGEPVGEMALFDPSGRRNARVVATTPVEVAYLGRHDVESLLADAPEVLAVLHGLSSSRDQESSTPQE
jgi:CRP-like cAMP-binding protein